MAESIDIDRMGRNLAEKVLDMQIASDGMTIRKLIAKYRAGELVDIVRCTECEKASCCPIGTKPIAEKMACTDGRRKGIHTTLFEAYNSGLGLKEKIVDK